MTELTDTERETLLDAVGFVWTSSDWQGIRDAVEAILTARLARVEALPDKWRTEKNATTWPDPMDWLDDLVAALAAPTPTEVQP